MIKGSEPVTHKAALGRRNFLKLGAGACAMVTALNSQEASAQSRVSEPVSIDLHTHWSPQAYIEALERLGKNAGSGTDPNSVKSNLDKRRKWMDEHGVQTQVLALGGNMPWQWAPSDVGAELAKIWNDAAVEVHTKYPDRFMAAIQMSIRAPDLALKELNRMAGKPGMRAVSLPNSLDGKDYLFESAYAPLLARIEELEYPLHLHPLDGAGDYYFKGRLGDEVSDRAYLLNSLGFPLEHATTAAKFIITGTLDKFPKLEVLLLHSGGAFPYIAGRIELGITSRKFPLQHQFKEYIRRFHYDTIAFYPETLRFLINLVGSDRVVIGSDNFASMDVEYPNALVEELQLPAEDRERILRGNAKRLLHL
jgi:aminocarboxymuconate-semialdehyde decarboxylase